MSEGKVYVDEYDVRIVGASRPNPMFAQLFVTSPDGALNVRSRYVQATLRRVKHVDTVSYVSPEKGLEVLIAKGEGRNARELDVIAKNLEDALCARYINHITL